MGNNFCSQCGTAIGAGVKFCPNCGQPAQGMPQPMAYPPPQYQPPQYRANPQAQYGTSPNDTANWALGLGIAAIFLLGALAGIPAIIVGNNAKKQLEATGLPTGKATAGIVMGVISLIWSFFLFIAIVSSL